MTQDFTNMLYLFGASALGKEIKTEYCKSLNKIRDLSLLQEVWDVVYSGVRPKIESGEVKIPHEIYLSLEKTFLANVALNIKKTQFNLASIRTLEENGIKCAILKGVTISRLYAMPEARISSDMDILIDIKEEKKAVEILTSLGYDCENRSKHDHHMKATHKKGGLLEVHVALHSVPTSDIILDDEIRYNEDFYRLPDGTYTLGIQDNIVYLSAHLIKHLINDATGVRQMMDLLLYMKEYENEIDWDKYNSLMKKLGYDTLIRVIKGIGVLYFGMEFDDAITEGNGLEELLEDCEIGGVFARNEKERARFYALFTQRRSKKGSAGYLIYRFFKSERSAFALLFPPVSAIKERFPYVKKHPVLLPIGWGHRFVQIFLKTSGKDVPKTGKDVKENDILARRIKMAEKLGMFKTEDKK